MKIQDFNYLVEDPSSVAWPVKAIALLAVCGFLLFMGYKLFIVDSFDVLEGVKAKESELKQTLELKQRRASQVTVYEQQLSAMQNSFGNLLQQLPSSTEIPSLVIDISEKGISNGLELELFEPLAEVAKEFYAEKPIKISAIGNYRELATFVSDISGLPRIVTIHDIKLESLDDPKKPKPIANKAKPVTLGTAGIEKDMTPLKMDAVIKTYRYLEESVTANKQLAATNDK